MKTYENTIDGIRYWYFYDLAIKSWTVFVVDEEGNQTGNSEYFANKKILLKNYKFDFSSK